MLKAGAEHLLAGLESHGPCEGRGEVGRVLELSHGGPGSGGKRTKPVLK